MASRLSERAPSVTETQTDRPAAELPRLYTDQEVADRLGVSRWTVRNLHRAGRMRGVVVARKLRFSAGAVERYLAELESEAQ